MNIFILILCVSVYVSTLEVQFEKFEAEYVNAKYFNSFNFTVRRSRRNRPYILNLDVDLVFPMGNNLTMDFEVFEIIAGRYILTPVKLVFHLCDALYKDKFVAAMFLKQLPKNWKCPLPAGVNNFTDVVLHFENLPFIPFTYSSLIVRIATVTNGSVHNDPAFRFKAVSVVTQKLEGKVTKKKTQNVDKKL